jgi:glycosyltransferase involved in cell wall biosynthesis
MKPKIKVLSLIDHLPFGGDEYRLLSLARTIDRSRFEYTLVTTFRPDASIDERYGSMRSQFLAAGVHLLDLSEVRTPGFEHNAARKSRTAALFRKVRKFTSLIRELDIDLLDIHLAPSNPAGVLAATHAGVPSVITAYNLTRMRTIRSWTKGQFTLAMADLLITDSHAQARKFRDWLLRPRPVQIIPNGTPAPQTEKSACEVRRYLGVPEDPTIRVIGQIASLVPYKGQRVLLNAARSILQQEPKCFFLVVGYTRKDEDLDYLSRLESQAAEAGITERVRILGYPGPIGDVWELIDIHVHPTLLDSLPNAIIESMSLAKPAVVTAVGGIPEMVEHEVTGLVVPPGDSYAVSQAVLRLIREPGLAERLGREARIRYQRRYRPEIMTSKLQDCFVELAARRHSHVPAWFHRHRSETVRSS